MFDVFIGDTQVGQANVKKCGLYYKIDCECMLIDKRVYRIVASNGMSKMNLGICIPREEKLILSTRIPIKKLSIEGLRFEMILVQNRGIRVASGKPFMFLDKLENARLHTEDGQSSIMID